MDCDVAVVGAGLVGASFVRALEGSGLRCALVEGAPPPPARPGAWDARVYALSPATQAFLYGIGAWQALDQSRLAPIYAMQVFGDRRSRLEFSAYECGYERLATIVEAGELQRALWRALQTQAQLELLCPSSPAALAHHPSYLEISLSGGETLTARLLVGADGANSWVREAAAIAARRSTAPRVAFVANFACEEPHRGTAFQWFREDGVLAWLPLPGERISIVWSTGQDQASELLALAPRPLCERVAEAGSRSLGTLELLGPPAAFAITTVSVARQVGPRVALVGDAAHVIHPLAGQGVNLGFGDARALARALRGATAARDPGDWLTLRRFERGRAEDILAMRLATEGLDRLFAARSRAVSAARNLGLNLTERLPVIKNLLARRAMQNG